MRTRSVLVLLGSILLVSSATRPQAAPLSDRVLFDFEGKFDLQRVATTDAAVALASTTNGNALRLTTGRQHAWPGITLRAPNGTWDLSPFSEIALALRNQGTNRTTVYCRVDNEGADGTQKCVSSSVTVEPGQEGTLTVALKRAGDDQLAGKLFGMRGYPVAMGGRGTIDPARVTQLLVFVSKPSTEHVFQIDDVHARGSYARPTAWTTDADPFFPFIDTFGQYKHRDWPGKVHSLQELKQRGREEAQELAAHPGPADWDQYGGWSAGPQLRSTGFFRTEKLNGKWWLVDPAGRLFFSQGIDCVRMRDVTPIDERANWFEAFPGDRDEFQPFLAARAYALKGHYAGRSPRSFSFGEANLFRKYGSDHRVTYPGIIHRRLRSWGLNTIGMWSDERTYLLRRTAYVDAIGTHGSPMIEGSEGYWGKFPDVWAPQFKAGLQAAMLAKVGKSAGDPWCLGYFADNEMSWGDETSLALAALRSPPEQPAKAAFLADLKGRYSDIAQLNAAWGTSHSSWEALRDSTTPPDLKKARPDLEAFNTRTAETYFRTVREAIKEKAPNQLYLGCRFAWVNGRAAAAAAKYCDVVSYNLYHRSVADFAFNGAADVPLIIGEFHFGALDRGMFHTGLVPVADQAARAKAYTDYVTGALRHSAFVGCHWFQYQDEPTIGRVYDEENYQIGFIDVADTPYRETVQASRDLADRLYPTRLSQ